MSRLHQDLESHGLVDYWVTLEEWEEIEESGLAASDTGAVDDAADYRWKAISEEAHRVFEAVDGECHPDSDWA